MDELSIAFLEANGYQYDNGAILDREGNYLSTLELKGQTLTSEIDADLYKSYSENVKRNQKNRDVIKQFQDYEKSGFNNNPLDTAIQYYPVLNAQKREPEILVYNPISNSKKLNTSSNKTRNSDFLFYDYPIVLAVSIIVYLLIKRFIK
jgi:hypothetical protein